MSEWWSYSLSDFLMFSPRTYWRMVEQYNQAVWPAQLVALAAGLTVLLLAPRRWRAMVLLLAFAWAWMAWAFLWERYAQINFAAAWLAAICGLQAALLAGAAFTGPRGHVTGVGTVLAALAVLAYPGVGLAFGRPIAQAEVFALMPDPTALATLGLCWRRGNRWLCVVPALSLIAGLATHCAMASMCG